MAIKFRNRYLVCSLHIKDCTPSLLKSVARQTILAAILASLQSLCGDVVVGRVKASLTIKDVHVVTDADQQQQQHVLFLLRVDRSCVREVWLALTCVTSVEMRVARIRVEDVGGGIEKVKERYAVRLTRGGVAEEEVTRRVAALET